MGWLRPSEARVSDSQDVGCDFNWVSVRNVSPGLCDHVPRGRRDEYGLLFCG